MQTKKAQRKKPFTEEKLPEVKSSLSRTETIGTRKEKIRLVLGVDHSESKRSCV